MIAEDIDKDIKRVLGKKLLLECELLVNKDSIILNNQDGVVEYCLNRGASQKIYNYIRMHPRSRLAKCFKSMSEFDLYSVFRFKI